MADFDRVEPSRAAITNIRDAAKWLLAALGAVFAIMLGGLQLNGLGLADPERVPPYIWVAVFAVFAVAMIVLWLGISVLVSDGITIDQLVTERRYRIAKDYLNKEWQKYDPSKQDPLTALYERYKDSSRPAKDGARPPTAEDKAETLQRLTEAVFTASWRMVLVRFHRLKVAMLCLVPAALLSVVALASQSGKVKDNQGPVAVPIALTLRLAPGDTALLLKSGWSPACVKSGLPVLIYAETSTGVADAETFPEMGCGPRHLLLLDRATLLKVF